MKTMDLFWLFLPDQAMPLVVVGLAFASILGLMRPKKAVGYVVMILLLPVVSAIVEEVFSALPWYVGIGVMVLLALNVIRLILELLFGREAAGHIIGHAVIGVFKGAFFFGVWFVRSLATGIGGAARLITQSVRVE